MLESTVGYHAQAAFISLLFSLSLGSRIEVFFKNAFYCHLLSQLRHSYEQILHSFVCVFI